MPNRTERREAERLARKLAYKQLRQEPVQESPQPVVAAEPQPDLLARAQAFFQTESEMSAISEAQLIANRANAQLSSGPKSPAGKAKSSMNALKHGLTGQTVVLAGDDVVEYHRKFDSYIQRLQPVGEEELRLVQSLLDATWRTDRILRMESSIFLKGQTEFENKFENRDPAERKALIQAETYLKYEKSLSNLTMQEARLRRCREKDQAELTRLQTMRKRDERVAAEAGKAIPHPIGSRPPATPPRKDGFVFSTPQTHLADPPPEEA